MTNIVKTFIAMIVDETGSMRSRAQLAIDTTNEFISAHSEIKECYATLVTFDKNMYPQLTSEEARSNVRFIADSVKITDVPMLSSENYNPNGMTNLYDAIGVTIRRMETLTKHLDEPTVIIMINTDGDENASSEYNGQMIKELIEEKKKLNWEFMFVGDELGDAKSNAMSGQIGITADMTFNVTAATRSAMFSSMASATSAYSTDAGVLGAKGPAGEKGVKLSSYMKNVSDKE